VAPKGTFVSISLAPLSPEFPDYWVCDHGQVFSGMPGRLVPMSLSRAAGPRGVLRTFLTDASGYQRAVSVGRLLLTTFTGPPPGRTDDWIVAYHNGDRSDCRLANLYWKPRAA
jgi:hypothetical protein